MAKDQLNALPPGYQLDDFTIESILGAGGFGITYLAHERTLDRKVAIKEFLPRSAVRGDDRSSVHPISTSDVEEFEYGLMRFRDEAQTLVGFRHPNIVSVFRYIQANGTAYIVMEYVEGKSLDELLRIGDTLNEGETREILFPLLDGLEAVHAAGFLHRDIKPANIFIQSDGMPVLLDFGAARHAIGAHSKSLTGILTPGFAPFEQYATRGKQGPWTDIYALAATLYRAITGAKPPEAIDRIERDNYVPAAMAAPPGFSPGFLHAIDEGLEMSAAERPQTVSDWRAMFLEDPAIQPGRPPAPPPVTPSDTPSPADTIVAQGPGPDAPPDDAPTQAAKRTSDDAPTQAAKGSTHNAGALPPATPQPGSATKPAAGSSAGRSSGRAALLIGGIVVVVALLAGGGYWAWSAYQEVERERIAAEQARREAELARQRAEQARRQAEAETKRRNLIEAERRRAEESRRRAEEEARRRAEQAKRRGEEEERRAEQRRQTARGRVQKRNYPGGRYEGTFVNGRRHGTGKYWWNTGDRYEGRWVNGNRTGFGRYWWANGNRYVGNFVNNQLSGQGTFYWRNGTRYVGRFVNGKFHGYGRIYWPSGARYFGQWRVGRRAEGTYWYPDGRRCRSRGRSCITAAR